MVIFSAHESELLSATFEGKGIVTAVFDANAISTLAPFNGMFTTGTHEED